MADLILALDVTERDQALRIARDCAPHLDAIKIGYPLVLSSGLEIAREIACLDIPVIADFKVADIPNTNRLITAQVFENGCSAVICQGFCGRDSVRACVDVAHASGGECYVVTEMSHPGAVEFFHNGVAERIAADARDCGADGIIAPATRPERIAVLRSLIGNLRIYSPGVGVQGGDAKSVSRLVDGIIVGRLIYEARDPADMAESLAAICR